MRIAIVGTGVSGLVAARHLYRTHDLTLFEADDRVGGHVHTWSLEAGGRRWAVDSGFMVFNEVTYPNFTELLAELGVASQPTTMSFSVRHDGAGLEYNGSSVNQLFAQRRNAFRPSFVRMLTEIVRFNRDAAASLCDVRTGRGETLGALLERGGYSDAFRDWYLVPMGSAIWSLPAARTLEMPAEFFVRFFENHGMLTVNDRPQWRVVRGGSQRYVEALIAPFRDRIRLRRPVRRVTRSSEGVDVDGERFDRVIFACHSDQALAMLGDPTPAEREVLGALPYQANDAVVHTDVSLLPARRRAWGAWNYRVGDDPEAPVIVTYNMNVLQSLDAPETFCVTLGGDDAVDPARVLGRVRYHHPVMTSEGFAARSRRADVSGCNRTHYCGAYWGYGFHEDGVVSGLAVAREIRAARRQQLRAVAV
jgi:predicted NAD/FAD-binding protein